MSNPPRVCLPNVTYHCYSRCIELRNLLQSKASLELAIKAITMAQKRYDFKLNHIEFVNNHFHIIIKTTNSGDTISRVMQYIKARIAEMYNKENERIGPFWNERFCCNIIEDAKDPKNHFYKLLWHIAYNPVRKGICNNPRDSPFGSIKVYLDPGYQFKCDITRHEYFNYLGNTIKECIENFLIFEKEYHNSATLIH